MEDEEANLLLRSSRCSRGSCVLKNNVGFTFQMLDTLYMGCDVRNKAWIERLPQEPEVSIDGTGRGSGSFGDDDRLARWAAARAIS
jgi:hypothetical protein